MGLSAAENAVKESAEEAGAIVEPLKLIALQDWEKNNGNGLTSAISVYKIFILCRYLGGSFTENIETTDSGWFSINEMPELSYMKNTPEQIKMCFEASENENWKVVFD